MCAYPMQDQCVLVPYRWLVVCVSLHCYKPMQVEWFCTGFRSVAVLRTLSSLLGLGHNTFPLSESLSLQSADDGS